MQYVVFRLNMHKNPRNDIPGEDNSTTETLAPANQYMPYRASQEKGWFLVSFLLVDGTHFTGTYSYHTDISVSLKI